MRDGGVVAIADLSFDSRAEGTTSASSWEVTKKPKIRTRASNWV
jgi:hypothetical protein